MLSMRRRARRPAACLLLLLVGAGLCASQPAVSGQPPAGGTNARDALLQARFRLLGGQVLPFSSEKQNAVIVGVANALGGGILASDVLLTVYATYQSITANGNSSSGSSGRRLAQQQTAFPGVDIGLNITTSQGQAGQQAQTLRDATNQTYLLSSTIGAQGLQTQQIVLQSTNVESANRTPPPAPAAASPPPPEAAQPPPAASPPPSPSQSPAAAQGSPTPVTTPSATTSGTAAADAAAAKAGGGGSSFPIGAIIGIVAGVVVLLLAVGLFFFLRRRRASYQQRGEVIDYFSDLGKQGSRDAGAGALPVTATSAADAPPAATHVPPPRRASREHNHIFLTGTNEKAEVPVTEIAEVPADRP